jgi:asparagine synthase (glutamine-hydrolysing)
VSAADGSFICGNVRLDEPITLHDHEVPRDLAILLARYQTGGIAAVTSTTGSYGVVIWDDRVQTLHAIRDALGLCALYRRAGRDLDISDVSEALATNSGIDRTGLAAFIATGAPPLSQTVWSGVGEVPAGSIVSQTRERVSTTQYWSSRKIVQQPRCDPRQVTRTFRSLVEKAVTQHLDADGRTWAHLSGGHDSSTVVAVAGGLVEASSGRRLGGTMTLVDSIGSGDESSFADTVTRRYDLPSVRIEDTWPWRDDGVPPPRTSHPTRDYPYYARDRLVAATLRDRGARSVLSGVGPDIYLPSAVVHATSVFWTGDPIAALRLLLGWSVSQGVGFWKTFGEYIVTPLAPYRLRRRQYRRRWRVPLWIRPRFESECGYADHLLTRNVHKGPMRDRLPALIEDRLATIGASLHDWTLYPGVETRHPLLYRPLVEFCLQLPFAERSDPENPKPILRRAMHGLVPDAVLRRRGKGSLILPRVCWAFGRERARLVRLLERSVLADIGAIEPRAVLHEIDEAARGRRSEFLTPLFFALSLDSWLVTRFRD